MQIYVQLLYPCRVLVGEDLQIYVQYFYPIWKGGGLIFMFWLFVWWLWWERVCRSMFNIYIRLGLWWKRICRSMFNIYIRFGRGGGLIFMFWLFLWGCGGRGFTDLCSISISVLGCGGRGFADLCSIFISDLDYSSKQNLFYVFGVFLDNRVRGRPLINVFPRVYFDFFGPTSRF